MLSRILHEGQHVCKEENRLLDYHHKLAQLCQIADDAGMETLKEEMVRVKLKYTFLESMNNEN